MHGKKTKSWESELAAIAAKHRGVLKPETVVAFAANPKTALHSRFTWDDSAAARAYRLWQARELISVAVIVLPQTGESCRAFVSMVADRQKDGGGYRAMISVLSDRGLRDKLLTEALAEFDRWKERYQALRELAAIFAARRYVKILGRKEAPKAAVAGG